MGAAEQHTKVHERMCIACGKKSGKQQFFRVVRNANGTLSFDASGKAPGRGAYVCSLTCFDNAVARNKLSRSLKCSVSAYKAKSVRYELCAHLRHSSSK